MHRSPPPFGGFEPRDHGPTSSPTFSSDPWGRLDEWRHWMSMMVADLTRRVMRLEEMKGDTLDVTRENGRRLDHLTEMVARLDEWSRVVLPHAPLPAAVPTWKERLESAKAVSTALMWLAGPLLILAHQMGWIDGQTAAAVKAALGAAGGGPGSSGEHGP